MRDRWTFIPALAVAVLGGCATVGNRDTVCPEYRSLRCATPPVCALDRSRGCEVCRCGELRQLDPPGHAPPGPGTPDRPSTEPPGSWTPRGP